MLDEDGKPDSCVRRGRGMLATVVNASRVIAAFRFLEAPATVSVGDYVNFERSSKDWFCVEVLDWQRRMVRVRKSKDVRALGAGPLRLKFVGGDGDTDGGDSESKGHEGTHTHAKVPARWIPMSRLSGGLLRRAKLSGRGDPIVYKLPEPSPEWGLRKLREWVREDKERMAKEAQQAREQVRSGGGLACVVRAMYRTPMHLTRRPSAAWLL